MRRPAVAALVAGLLGGLPQHGSGMIWSISGGLSKPPETTRKRHVPVMVSESTTLAGLDKFDFEAGGSFELNATVQLQLLQARPSVARYFQERNMSIPLIHLLACTSEEYANLYELESARRGTFCETRFDSSPGFCQRWAAESVPLGWAERNQMVGQWHINTTRVSVPEPGVLYFLVSACGFMDAFPATSSSMTVHASLDLSNSNGSLLDRQEAQRLNALGGLCAFAGVGTLIWLAHMAFWRKTLDICLQRSLAVLFTLKTAVLVLEASALALKSEQASQKAIDSVFYMRFGLSTLYFILFIEKTLYLCLGYKITINHLNPVDKLRVSRLTLGFGVMISLLLWWGSTSMMLWVVLMLLYVLLTSTMYQVVSVAVRRLERVQMAVTHQLGHAQDGADPERTHRLVQRAVFVRLTLRKFSVLQLSLISYFCIGPLLLLLLQVVLFRTDANIDHTTAVTTLADCLDLLFFFVLGLNYRARQLSGLVADRSAVVDVEMAETGGNDGDSVRAELDRSSGRVASEASTVRSSAVVPLVAEDQPAGKASGAATFCATPVLRVETYKDPQPVVAIQHNYL